MISFKDYNGLADTLLNLKRQVIDSISFAQKVIPSVSTPEELFYFLKQHTIYRSDPKHTDGEDIELLMTMQTLMNGSRTGTPGAGDCDDFTITSLASLIASGFKDVRVILVGRNFSHPVHIYAGVVENGTVIPFDLTNEQFGVERNNYKYRQILVFGL